MLTIIQTSLVGRQHIVTGNGGNDGVTISNHFVNGSTSWSAECNSYHYWGVYLTGTSDTITFQNNYIYHTSGRSPKLGGGATVHMPNNYWDDIQGTRRALVAAAPRRRRLCALFSLRSFRRGARESALERRSERARVRARAAADRRGAELRRRRAAPGSRPATGGGALTPQNLLPAMRGFLSRLAGRIPRAPRKVDRR